MPMQGKEANEWKGFLYMVQRYTVYISPHEH